MMRNMYWEMTNIIFHYHLITTTLIYHRDLFVDDVQKSPGQTQISVLHSDLTVADCKNCFLAVNSI